MTTDHPTRARRLLPGPRNRTTGLPLGTDAARGAPPSPPAAPLAAASMVVGAACLAVAQAVQVEVGGPWSTEAMLLSIAERPGRWMVWSLLIMAVGLFLLPGVVAWRTRVAAGPSRGRGLTTVGSVVLGASLVALFGFGGSHAYSVDMVGGEVPTELVVAYARADEGLGVAVTSVLALFGFHLGVPLFLAGLARARQVSWRFAAFGGVAALASFVVGEVSWWLGVGTFVAVAAILGWLGLRLVAPPAGAPGTPPL